MDAGRLKNICGLMCLKMRHSGGLCGTGSNGLQFALILISAKAYNGAAFLVQFLHDLEFSWCSSPSRTQNRKSLNTTDSGQFLCMSDVQWQVLFPTSQVLYHSSGLSHDPTN